MKTSNSDYEKDAKTADAASSQAFKTDSYMDHLEAIDAHKKAYKNSQNSVYHIRQSLKHEKAIKDLKFESVELDESRVAELHDSIDRHIEPHIRAYKTGAMDADTLGHRIVKAHDKIAKDTGHPVELVRRLVNDHVDDRLSESVNESISEAARGTLHRVEFKYDTYEKDGSLSTSTGITKLYAPSKEHAKRYATNDLAHKYTGFKATRATEIKSQNEEIKMKPTHKVILEAIERVKDKMNEVINEEFIENELDEAFDGTHVVIDKPGHLLHGRRAAVFHRFDDGRVNAQARTGRGMKDHEIHNVTLHPGEFSSDFKPLTTEAVKGSPWDKAVEPLSHYLPAKPKDVRTGEHGEKIMSVKGSSYGKDDDDEDEDGNKKVKFEPPVKRGRGRPAGSKSGARTHGEDGGVKNQAIYGGREHSVLSPTPSRFSK